MSCFDRLSMRCFLFWQYHHLLILSLSKDEVSLYLSA